MTTGDTSYNFLLQENQALRVRLAEAERMLAEQTAAEHRIQTILDKLAAGVLVLDMDGRFIFANQRVANMFDRASAELVGQTLFDVLPPDVATAYYERNRRFIAAKSYEEYEATFELPVGSRTFFIADQVLTNAQGEGEILLSSSIDITARRQVEQALQESEAHYRLLSEHSTDVIWTLDLASFRFTYVSPSVQRLRGYTVEEVLAQPVDAALTPESQQHIAATLPARIAAFMAGDETARSGTTEVDQPRKDGSIVPTEVVTTLLTDAHGQVTTVLGVSRDITARKQAEAALRQLNETLELRVAARTTELAHANEHLARAARLKDEFLARMSHELRTPLNTILGRLELLQEELEGPLTPRQHDSLRRIETSGRHLLMLITDILDLSTIEAGTLTLDYSDVDVGHVCQQSRQRVVEQAMRKRLTISTALDPQVATIRADERWLTHILVNLLANAVKFTPEGGAIGVEVRSHPEQQCATFTVWDTGIGIAEANLHHLFQPFVQLDGGLNRQYEGTGLGLVLVKRLTEAHGGSISVESKPGQGSRFSVHLPLSGVPYRANT